VTIATDETLRRLLEQAVYTPVRQGSAVADTVARLGRAISIGLLRAGDWLPPEGQLAADLGISPVTLRSALGILRSAGLVETRRGRGGGTFVSPHGSPDNLLGSGPLPSTGEVRDLVDYRCVIEGGTAWLSAERATEAQIAYLEALVSEMREIRSFDLWSERDSLFHLIVADASGSRRLVEQVAAVRGEVYRLAKLGTVPEAAVQLSDREHEEIVRAIAARQPAQAQAAMTRHVASTGSLWLGLGRVAGDQEQAGGGKR
jgi:GntR family transcriptional repressor for pyruvate dehydrogenase complex